MGNELQEIAKRYRDLHLKCVAGDYQEIDRESFYHDIHVIAERLRDLEERGQRTDAIGHVVIDCPNCGGHTHHLPGCTKV